MKFGKDFVKNQVPEWSNYYIDYKKLKHTTKSIKQEKITTDEKINKARDGLHLEFVKCNTFYEKVLQDIVKSFSTLKQEYTKCSGTQKNKLNMQISKNYKGSLHDLKIKTQKIKTFCELNNKAITKIYKKIKKLLQVEELDRNNLFGFSCDSQAAERVEKEITAELKNLAIVILSPEALVLDLETSPEVMDLVTQDLYSKLLEELGKQTDKEKIKDIFEKCLYNCAFKCVEALLDRYEWLLGYSDINQRSIIHIVLLLDVKDEAFVSSFSQHHKLSHTFLEQVQQTSKSLEGYSPNFKKNKQLMICNNEMKCRELLKTTLKKVFDKKEHNKMILHRDIFGRTAVHYSIFSMDQETTKTLLSHLAKCDIKSSEICDAWEDFDGCSPLFYAVVNGFHFGVRKILECFADMGIKILEKENVSKLLYHSVYENTPKIMGELLRHGADSNLNHLNGENILHTSTRLAHKDCLNELLNLQEEGIISLDLNSKTTDFSYTPLILAASTGCEEIIKLLVSSGASLTCCDTNHWKAFDHAVYHGHIRISDILRDGLSPTMPERVKYIHDFKNKKSKIPSDKYQVILTLGSYNTEKSFSPISFKEESKSLMDYMLNFQGLKLEIFNNKTKDRYCIVLPVESLVSFEFALENSRDVYFTVNLVSCDFNNEIIACAYWKMTSKCSNTYNSSHYADVCIPLFDTKRLDIIGDLEFNFTIIYPFENIPETVRNQDWSFSSTRVIGHRGFGANKSSKELTSLQVGENTLLSFNTASSFGLDYIEFDVQLTKDHVPVIYHDFLVSETRCKIPLSLLTHDEFMDAYDKNINHEYPFLPKVKEGSKKNRSRSVILENTSHLISANSKVASINERFTTLKNIFENVSEKTGFNVELKYPDFHDGSELEVQTSIDLNIFVDKILDCVFDEIKKKPRNIIFSSFSPEICSMLKHKQNVFPIFYLSDCGYSNSKNARCSSLKEAVRFAKNLGLCGIVTVNSPFIESPILIKKVKDAGLMLFTYGQGNNNIQNALLQKEIGVDAVIVDSVAAVKKELLD